MISFSSRVKEDITFNSVSYSLPRKKAILAGFIALNGFLGKREGVETLILNTDQAKIAKYLYQLFKDIYGVEANFSYITEKRFGKRTLFVVLIRLKVKEIIEDLALDFLSSSINRKIVYSDDTLAGYVTGAFLGGGSVTSPTSSNYHLEIIFADNGLANRVAKALSNYQRTHFSPKVTTRRNKYIVYIKRSDQIATFLIFIGASNCSLEFESVRIDRDMAISANRMLLCDEANYAKTLRSSQKQIQHINIVKKYYGEKPQDNEKLSQLMKIRLANEDANMNELATLLTVAMEAPKPISKGNVNHLFIKLKELAKPYMRVEENE